MSDHTHHRDGDHSDWTPRFDAAHWDENYASASALWSGRPNPVLVAETADLPAGRAIDIGCGEGADVLWLAERGWQVLGVDISQVALDRAAAHVAAAELGDRIAWEQHDLLTWSPPPRSFDLVSVQFFHLTPDIRPRIYDRLADAVAPGGTFLVVAHHPSDLATTMSRPPAEELFFTADELAARLDQEWEVQVADARPRTATDPDGREITITDTVLKARRQPSD